MEAGRRRVTETPLRELWDERGGAVAARRVRDAGAADVAGLLRAGAVQFVVASVGEKLEWVAPGECYAFWKSEVRAHLADPEAPARLESFPNQYCYFASEWEQDGRAPIVLLEKHH